MNATYETVENTVKLADGINTRNSEAIGALMEALVAVGILMAYVGNSRPASGSEHHMSHYFEIVGIVRGEEYLPHGIDVCCSAVETARLREKLLSLDSIDDMEYSFDKEEYDREIARIYGNVADEVIALQNKMGWYSIDRINIYKEKWAEIRAILSDCPSSERMLDLCEKVDISYSKFAALYGEEKIADGILYSKDLKDRYTVLWMYYDLFRNKNR
jgi:glycerol-1-phosphate dehydrogenase [NAD(P)+]